MENLFDLAQAWLEHCRDQEELAELSGDYENSDWPDLAEQAEKIIKNAIDRGVQV